MAGMEIMLMGILAAMQNGSDFPINSPFETPGGLKVAENKNLTENPMPREIKVTSWQNMPYSGYIKKANGEYEGVGYAFDMLKLIQRQLNFNYTIVPPKKEVLGDETKGVIKQLLDNEVDMAVAFIPILTTLQEYCQYSGVLDDVEISFMMKRPRGSAIGSGLLAPFNETVWWCILGALIIVGPVIWIVITIRTKATSRGHPEGYSLYTCVWFSYGALLKQGSTITPVTATSRMLFATWWVFITILTSFYTANLTAFLTLSEYTLPYKKITDITKKSQNWIAYEDQVLANTIDVEYLTDLEPLKWARNMYQGSFIEQANKTELQPNFDQIKKRIYIDKGPLYIGDKLFMQDLMFRDYRVLTIKAVEERSRCVMVMQPESLYTIERAFAYPKGSLIAEHMDKKLENLVETGMIKHLKKEALPGVQYCPLDLKSTERRLAMEDLTMTFYCVAVGIILSSVTFVVEQIWEYHQTHKHNVKSSGACCDALCFNTNIKASAELPIYDPAARMKFSKFSKDEDPVSITDTSYENPIAKKQVINGRDYWLIKAEGGDRLVPIRSPSAVLFSYDSYLDNPGVREGPKISDNCKLERLEKKLRFNGTIKSTAELPIYDPAARMKFSKFSRDEDPVSITDTSYDNPIAKKQVINGRDYWLIRAEGGDRLVPIRSPSAVLFSYDSYLDNPGVREGPKISDNWFIRK